MLAHMPSAAIRRYCAGVDSWEWVTVWRWSQRGCRARVSSTVSRNSSVASSPLQCTCTVSPARWKVANMSANAGGGISQMPVRSSGRYPGGWRRAVNPWMEPSSTSLTWPNRSRSVLPDRSSSSRSTATEGSAPSASPPPMWNTDSRVGYERVVDHLVQTGDRVVLHQRRVAEVDDRGDALVAGVGTEAAQTVGVEAHGQQRRHTSRQAHRHRLTQLTGRLARAVPHDALDPGVGGDAVGLQDRGVRRAGVEALVHHEDRPGARDGVEVAPVEPVAGEVDRVQPPGQQRLGRVLHLGVGLAQPAHHVVERLAAGPRAPVGTEPSVEADVGVPPQRAAHRVRVRLHEAGEQHAVGVPLVHRGVAVRRELGPAPHGTDAVALDRDRLRGRPGGIHRAHQPRRIDGQGHDASLCSWTDSRPSLERGVHSDIGWVVRPGHSALSPKVSTRFTTTATSPALIPPRVGARL